MRLATLFAAVAAAILITGLTAFAAWSLVGPSLRLAQVRNAGLIMSLAAVILAAILLVVRRRGEPPSD